MALLDTEEVTLQSFPVGMLDSEQLQPGHVTGLKLRTSASEIFTHPFPGYRGIWKSQKQSLLRFAVGGASSQAEASGSLPVQIPRL